MGLAVDMIIAAEEDLGLGEPNYIQDWYDREFGDLGYNWAWCNAAITWWAHKSGNAEAVCLAPNGHYAYTVWHAQAFERAGQWHYGSKGIKAGDVVFFDWWGQDRISAIDHVGLVVDVKSDGIHTIEGNINNRVERRVRTDWEIAGYGRPKYDAVAAPPGPADPDGNVYEPPPFPNGLAPWRTSPSAKPLQEALKAAGYMADSVPLADNYGPKTQASVAAFYNANPELRVSTYDTKIGPLGWAELHREAYGAQVPAVPEPEPSPDPVLPEPQRVAVFEDVYYGAPVNESVRVVQEALDAEFGGVHIDGDFGPQTKGAYQRWQWSLGFTGSAADGNPGIQSFTRLANKYHFTVLHRTPDEGAEGEPAHDYRRVTWSGRTINARTKIMLDRAAKINGSSFTVTQGSYNAGGVSASAGTHDGGGVVDVAAAHLSGSARIKLVTALRQAGFAAWLRTPSQGPWGYHVHACAIGDREMAPVAERQVASYFAGRNGLANNGPDDHPAGRPFPSWAEQYN